MEFEFKIIGVEKGTHSLTSENGDKWDVDNLPDAPIVAENATVEKHEIELPVDMVAKVERLHKGFQNNIVGFVTSFNDQKFYNAFGGKEKTRNIMAEYFNGHVEFVPKKDPLFYIKIVDVFDKDGNELYLASMGNNKFRMTIYTDRAEMLTEDEADKIIADVLNSNVSLTARKVKVEE